GRYQSGRGLLALKDAGAVLNAAREAARFWSAGSPLPLWHWRAVAGVDIVGSKRDRELLKPPFPLQTSLPPAGSKGDRARIECRWRWWHRGRDRRSQLQRPAERFWRS